MNKLMSKSEMIETIAAQHTEMSKKQVKIQHDQPRPCWPFDGLQAASDSESRVAAPLVSGARRPAHCQQKSGSIGGACSTGLNRLRDYPP